jgi:hypothetical protein
MNEMRREFDAGREPDSGDAKPEKFSPEKQNDRADENAQNWNRKVHGAVNVFIHVILTEVEESLTISVFESAVSTEISKDVSRSTRCARSGQALKTAATPLLNGCNVTLPLDMTTREL